MRSGNARWREEEKERLTACGCGREWWVVVLEESLSVGVS